MSNGPHLPKDLADRPKLCRELILARFDAGLSTYDLARLTGIARSHIGHYETGYLTPGPMRLAILRAALGIEK